MTPIAESAEYAIYGIAATLVSAIIWLVKHFATAQTLATQQLSAAVHGLEKAMETLATRLGEHLAASERHQAEMRALLVERVRME